jgi:hypothetical protein
MKRSNARIRDWSRISEGSNASASGWSPPLGLIQALPERVYPRGHVGTDLAALGGAPRSTVGSGGGAAGFDGSAGFTETTSTDGTEMTSARTAMGPTKAQTNARAPSRERRLVEGHVPEI